MTDVPRITPEGLSRALESGEDVVVVDVRRGSWDASDEKIRGAIRIDPDDYAAESSRIPRGSRVVTYCT